MPNPIVRRQIQTHTTVDQPVSDDSLAGLPFYYYFDMRFCVLLIILGIIAAIVQFMLMAGLIAIPFMRKKYICLQCKHDFREFRNPHVCPICKGMVVTEKEYYSTYKNFENLGIIGNDEKANSVKLNKNFGDSSDSRIID